MKARHHLYIDEELTLRLEQLAAKPGASRSAIVSDALRAYLDSRAADQIDEKLRTRFGKLSGQLERIERDIGIVMESLALFIRYELMITPPLPEADQMAARALAQDRFQSFLDQVGRRLANGRSLHKELLARVPASEAAHDR